MDQWWFRWRWWLMLEPDVGDWCWWQVWEFGVPIRYTGIATNDPKSNEHNDYATEILK